MNIDSYIQGFFDNVLMNAFKYGEKRVDGNGITAGQVQTLIRMLSEKIDKLGTGVDKKKLHDLVNDYENKKRFITVIETCFKEFLTHNKLEKKLSKNLDGVQAKQLYQDSLKFAMSIQEKLDGQLKEFDQKLNQDETGTILVATILDSTGQDTNPLKRHIELAFVQGLCAATLSNGKSHPLTSILENTLPSLEEKDSKDGQQVDVVGGGASIDSRVSVSTDLKAQVKPKEPSSPRSVITNNGRLSV